MTEKVAVSVNEAGEMLGLGRDIVYRLIFSNQLDSFKVGSRRLVKTQAIRDFVEAQTAEVASK